MLIILSPAKTLDYESPVANLPLTTPAFMSDAARLISRLRELSPAEIGQLMSISDKLAALNAARFAEWSPKATAQNSRAAILAFMGDVYEGLAAREFSSDDHAYAQQHLRILSGLYGLLRPLDRLQPYRLEMGTSLTNPAGKHLYAFWGDKVALALNEALMAQGDEVLINLASEEYSKVALIPALKARVVTPKFYEIKNGQAKIVSFHAKKARGLMAAWMIRQRLKTIDQLRAFEVADYRFNPSLSDGDVLAFSR